MQTVAEVEGNPQRGLPRLLFPSPFLRGHRGRNLAAFMLCLCHRTCQVPSPVGEVRTNSTQQPEVPTLPQGLSNL